MSIALARKWRPKKFSELVGQDHVVRALSNALTQGRVHHAWMFTGTRGVGKTTLARIIAKALNCQALVDNEPCGTCDSCESIDRGRYVDVIELDAASNTQVDNMRELLETAAYAPSVGSYKIFIIDEVHMLSKSAFNAMLKTLEEPPEHVKFILATTDPQKVPVTVLSRCLQFNLKPIPATLIGLQLTNILSAENITCEDQAIQILSQQARGSLRDGLSLLDQAIAQDIDGVKASKIREMLGLVDETVLSELLDSILTKDIDRVLELIEQVESLGASFVTILDDLALSMQKLALAGYVESLNSGADASILEKASINIDQEHLQLLYQIATLGKRDIVYAPNEKAGFTMVILRMFAFLPTSESEQVIKKTPAKKRVAKISDSSVVREKTPAENKTVESQDVVNRLDWESFVSSSITGMGKMLAENCEFKNIENGTLFLKIADENKHLLDDRYKDKLLTAVRTKLGEKIRLDIAVTGASQTPLMRAEDDERKELASATKDIEQDPFVQSLQAEMGGKLVKESIRRKN
jgi:DNA polymerase-3 subunit gamma/tau